MGSEETAARITYDRTALWRLRDVGFMVMAGYMLWWLTVRLDGRLEQIVDLLGDFGRRLP